MSVNKPSTKKLLIYTYINYYDLTEAMLKGKYDYDVYDQIRKTYVRDINYYKKLLEKGDVE